MFFHWRRPTCLDLVRSGCLSLAELSSVLAQAGAGLQGMQHKVVHMDVKPDNILLKRDEQSGGIIAKVLFRTRGGVDLHNSFLH